MSRPESLGTRLCQGQNSGDGAAGQGVAARLAGAGWGTPNPEKGSGCPHHRFTLEPSRPLPSPTDLPPALLRGAPGRAPGTLSPRPSALAPVSPGACSPTPTWAFCPASSCRPTCCLLLLDHCSKPSPNNSSWAPGQLRLPFATPAAHHQCDTPSPARSVSDQLPARVPGKAVQDSPVLGPPQATWQTQTELQAPGSGLAQTQLLPPCGE